MSKESVVAVETLTVVDWTDGRSPSLHVETIPVVSLDEAFHVVEVTAKAWEQQIIVSNFSCTFHVIREGEREL